MGRARATQISTNSKLDGKLKTFTGKKTNTPQSHIMMIYLDKGCCFVANSIVSAFLSFLMDKE
jgi:hypothetical protein